MMLQACGQSFQAIAAFTQKLQRDTSLFSSSASRNECAYMTHSFRMCGLSSGREHLHAKRGLDAYLQVLHREKHLSMYNVAHLGYVPNGYAVSKLSIVDYLVQSAHVSQRPDMKNSRPSALPQDATPAACADEALEERQRLAERDVAIALDLGLLYCLHDDLITASDPFYNADWICWAQGAADAIIQSLRSPAAHSKQALLPVARALVRLFDSSEDCMHPHPRKANVYVQAAECMNPTAASVSSCGCPHAAASSAGQAVTPAAVAVSNDDSSAGMLACMHLVALSPVTQQPVSTNAVNAEDLLLFTHAEQGHGQRQSTTKDSDSDHKAGSGGDGSTQSVSSAHVQGRAASAAASPSGGSVWDRIVSSAAEQYGMGPQSAAAYVAIKRNPHLVDLLSAKAQGGMWFKEGPDALGGDLIGLYCTNRVKSLHFDIFRVQVTLATQASLAKGEKARDSSNQAINRALKKVMGVDPDAHAAALRRSDLASRHEPACAAITDTVVAAMLVKLEVPLNEWDASFWKLKAFPNFNFTAHAPVIVTTHAVAHAKQKHVRQLGIFLIDGLDLSPYWGAIAAACAARGILLWPADMPYHPRPSLDGSTRGSLWMELVMMAAVDPRCCVKVSASRFEEQVSSSSSMVTGGSAAAHAVAARTRRSAKRPRR